jgi:paired amphipathic helix protein Sin3a
VLTASREQQPQFKLSPDMISSVHLLVLRNLYGVKSDIVKLLNSHPFHVIPLVLPRLKSKNQELLEVRQKWTKSWRRGFEENYKKSLDYESEFWKEDQKRLLYYKNIVVEAESRRTARSTRKFSLSNTFLLFSLGFRFAHLR